MSSAESQSNTVPFRSTVTSLRSDVTRKPEVNCDDKEAAESDKCRTLRDKSLQRQRVSQTTV